MQSTAPISPASPIPVPVIDIDEPVAVIPTASVAPLDGPPDGERITTYALVPQKSYSSSEDYLETMRARVLNKPLTWVAAAFSVGFVLSRMRR